MMDLLFNEPICIQDSLGGNSKTTIIANVSPSIWYDGHNLKLLCKYFIDVGRLRHFLFCCCSSANETLSTLKFAQRAKLIQNNVWSLNLLV